MNIVTLCLIFVILAVLLRAILLHANRDDD